MEQNTFRTNLSHCLSLSCITTLKTILSYDNCSEYSDDAEDDVGYDGDDGDDDDNDADDVDDYIHY